ncbi:hypothetical protein J2X19_000136 [Rhodoferax ferrireducens]|uniref:Histidine kinase/HSP90-like ATPase domain-containing protein n=1 Tax=Rhodoferax ferrireducens TaxID=192843 RepID=A0ABU2C2D2_9BURK|nr:ATP-binding protein [Rhodoferax ferrireducens]MDR7375478.1 hypothetical protein [Rhodoferax ferrireducens]
MEIELPPSVGSQHLGRLFSICTAIDRTDDLHVILDASEVSSIDPQGFTILAALFSRHPSKKISIHWLRTSVASYMSRMDFFNHFDVDGVEIPQNGRNDQRSGLTELTCVESYADSDAAANRLADAITGTLTNADPNAVDAAEPGQFGRFKHPIFYSLSELLDNALTHARQQDNQRAQVWVAAQFYRGNGTVKMSVVDNGCGMLATLKNHPKLPERTHVAAINTALISRVSCNRNGNLYNTHGNQGVGLTTTAKIAKSAHGSLTIASGDAFVMSSEGRSGIWTDDAYWQGVSIGLVCKRGLLPSIRVRELLPPEDTDVDISFL